MDGDTIKDLAFTGHGCAISQASTSIMIDLIKGKTKEEAINLINIFIKMIKRESVAEEDLEKARRSKSTSKHIKYASKSKMCRTSMVYIRKITKQIINK